jgi:adenylate kinase family enzyme
MRIAIIGNSGSGKSTLAGRLAERHGLAALDLDTVAWEVGQIAVPRPPAESVADVQAFCAAHEHWVVEGCYASLVSAALGAAEPVDAPTLLFLDPGVDACLANCRVRPWEPHKYASMAEQDEKLGFLLSWVRAYYTRSDDHSLVAHQALFDAYGGPKQTLVSLRNAEVWPGERH